MKKCLFIALLFFIGCDAKFITNDKVRLPDGKIGVVLGIDCITQGQILYKVRYLNDFGEYKEASFIEKELIYE